MSFFVNLAKANAELARLNTDLAAALAERDTLKAAIAERDAAAESVRAQFDAAVGDLTSKLSIANDEIVALKAAAKTAGQQAAEVIAAQGVAADKMPKDSTVEALSADKLAAAIRAETDPIKRAHLFSQFKNLK
jgi:septal ring factor EnvC (AmiA/AmiB activator)